MYKTIKNMTVAEFSYWWQRANGYRAESNGFWEARQAELVRFLEEVRKQRSN